MISPFVYLTFNIPTTSSQRPRKEKNTWLLSSQLQKMMFLLMWLADLPLKCRGKVATVCFQSHYVNRNKQLALFYRKKCTNQFTKFWILSNSCTNSITSYSELQIDAADSEGLAKFNTGINWMSIFPINLYICFFIWSKHPGTATYWSKWINVQLFLRRVEQIKVSNSYQRIENESQDSLEESKATCNQLWS